MPAGGAMTSPDVMDLPIITYMRGSDLLFSQVASKKRHSPSNLRYGKFDLFPLGPFWALYLGKCWAPPADFVWP